MHRTLRAFPTGRVEAGIEQNTGRSDCGFQKSIDRVRGGRDFFCFGDQHLQTGKARRDSGLSSRYVAAILSGGDRSVAAGAWWLAVATRHILSASLETPQRSPKHLFRFHKRLHLTLVLRHSYDGYVMGLD